jgi:hypothetical protein
MRRGQIGDFFDARGRPLNDGESEAAPTRLNGAAMLVQAVPAAPRADSSTAYAGAPAGQKSLCTRANLRRRISDKQLHSHWFIFWFDQSVRKKW